MIRCQSSILPLLITVLISINLSGFAQRRPKDKILHAKVFVVTIEQQQIKKKKELPPFEDELTFKSNKFTSKHMRHPDTGGFQQGEYAISKKEELLGETVYHFEAINSNSKGMSLKWEGRVFGNQIEGTAIVSKNGKVKQEFTFSGTLKIK